MIPALSKLLGSFHINQNKCQLPLFGLNINQGNVKHNNKLYPQQIFLAFGIHFNCMFCSYFPTWKCSDTTSTPSETTQPPVCGNFFYLLHDLDSPYGNCTSLIFIP
ncbi:hypothetical protein GOP47_0021293 [Adiantum capillus-veneris]|uniref:Uncharacterized protein n=1 Tax=Adiantum capillus-veneris TaxID=13818 RepID=A0A9D4UBT2_ADICA|nr:hypothetical protein GOP47_0021293 [Adiantum capillus-veneris]